MTSGCCSPATGSSVTLLPDGEEIFVWPLFVGGYLGGRHSLSVNDRGILAAIPIPSKEVRGGAALGLGPALEGVTGARRDRLTIDSTVDRDGLVDLDAGIGTIQGTLATVLRTIVAVPVDMGRRLLLLVLIDSYQLNCVCI